MAVFGLVGMIVTGIATFIHLIGLASPWWNLVLSVNYGIWKLCHSGTCVDLDTATYGSWLFVVRAFTILAFLILCGATFLSFLGMFVFKDKKVIPIIAMMACLVPAGFIFLALSIYGANNGSTSYHFAFVFEILAMLISGAAGFLHFMQMRSLGSAPLK